MKLGTYVEVALSVKDIATAHAFYEAIGFKKIGDDVMTDGSINIRMIDGKFSSPSLSYKGSDMQGILALMKGEPEKGKPKHLTSGEFRSPNGLRVVIAEEKSKVKMPGGTPTTRTPISRCGKFGEFTVPVRDLPKAMGFWMALGFEALHAAEIPYPYAILSDGLIILGLHQTKDFDEIALTYFAIDMVDRIEALQHDQLKVMVMQSGKLPDGRYQHAVLNSPDGQGFLLFDGEI